MPVYLLIIRYCNQYSYFVISILIHTLEKLITHSIFSSSSFRSCSGTKPKVFYEFFFPSTPPQYLRVFAKVFITLVLVVVSRNDEAAATAINTWPVVNVSRAPGLCLFGRVSFVSLSFLFPPPLFCFSFGNSCPKPAPRKRPGVSLLLRPPGCLTRPVADSLNELLFVDRRFFQRYARSLFFFFFFEDEDFLDGVAYCLDAFRCHSLIHYHAVCQ